MQCPVCKGVFKSLVDFCVSQPGGVEFKAWTCVRCKQLILGDDVSITRIKLRSTTYGCLVDAWLIDHGKPC